MKSLKIFWHRLWGSYYYARMKGMEYRMKKSDDQLRKTSILYLGYEDFLIYHAYLIKDLKDSQKSKK